MHSAVQSSLVFVFIRREMPHGQVLASNVTDSWMLLPVPLFFFTPAFVAFLGCLYAGLVVPALNSIKVLLRSIILVLLLVLVRECLGLGYKVGVRDLTDLKSRGCLTLKLKRGWGRLLKSK